MAKDNGGIIGVLNTPSTTSAKGVWALEDQYQARTTNTWPGQPQPYSIDFLVVAGGGGSASYYGGGGGGGGYRTSTQTAIPGTVITVTVGDGGAGGAAGGDNYGTRGSILQFQVQD
jgi:hypothetical protein